MREKLSIFVDKNNKLLLWGVCATGAAFYLFKFLFISISRIHYPFALEWMEGASLAQVQRVLEGKPLYVRPSIYYVPLIYPPLYFYLSAVFAKLTGLNLFSLRLVSLLSSLGTMVVVGRIIHLQTKSLLPVILSIGLFAGTFYLSGGWFDVARVDMLATFLFFISLNLIYFKKPLYFIFGGVSVALACITKQTFLMMAIFLSIGLILDQLKVSKYFLLSFILTSFFSILLFTKLYDEWYGFFVFTLPGRHVLFQGWIIFIVQLKAFIFNSVFYVFPVPVVFSIIYYFGCQSEFNSQTINEPFSVKPFKEFANAPKLFWFIVMIGSLAISWSGYINPGGYNNVLLPLYTILSILCGLGLNKLLELKEKNLYISVFILISLAFQFYLLGYSVKNEIPTRKDLEIGYALVNELKSHQGDVFIPFHPELAILAGKPVFASWVALYELEGGYTGGDKDEWQRVRLQIVRIIKNKKFDLIIIDSKQIWGQPEKYYSSCELSLKNTDAFYPVTGWHIRPVKCFVLYKSPYVIPVK